MVTARYLWCGVVNEGASRWRLRVKIQRTAGQNEGQEEEEEEGQPGDECRARMRGRESKWTYFIPLREGESITSPYQLRSGDFLQKKKGLWAERQALASQVVQDARHPCRHTGKRGQDCTRLPSSVLT